ncbi:tryptophan--tRNA ligase [Patescibacteria group bacterium]|jgi:tryptophanyl-tRNA synthetase|nr:tryptophan--tRNA ligase [Patescibacteria group bacterium]
MKDLVFSGIKPTSVPHLGNYIGAIKQWVDIQKNHRCLFSIVDLHAITVPQDPKEMRQNTLDIAATYLACGIDPARSTIYIQSEVAEHAELAWILGTVTKMGELERMTQFKDKSQKGGRERAGLGLFAYPALMAADILLYDTSAVPVGEDQMQHLELARVIARRFNQEFGETFVIPQALIQKHGSRIMSLQDADKKMSKSDESKSGTIMLDDDADAIRKKIMRAVTDTGGGVYFEPEKKPAVSNLMTIYHHLSGKTMKEIETLYEGKGYGDFKKDLAEIVVDYLGPIREKLETFRREPGELHKVLDAGRDKAKAMAEAKMELVRERVGLGR